MSFSKEPSQFSSKGQTQVQVHNGLFLHTDTVCNLYSISEGQSWEREVSSQQSALLAKVLQSLHKVLR